jgi:hypothetical protein
MKIAQHGRSSADDGTANSMNLDAATFMVAVCKGNNISQIAAGNRSRSIPWQTGPR